MTIDSQASYDDKNLDVETENYLNSSAPEICDDIRWRFCHLHVLLMKG